MGYTDSTHCVFHLLQLMHANAGDHKKLCECCAQVGSIKGSRSAGTVLTASWQFLGLGYFLINKMGQQLWQVPFEIQTQLNFAPRLAHPQRAFLFLIF